MKTNPVKQLLKAGKPTFGTWLSLGDLLSTRILARMGYDWLTVDLEHASIDWGRAAALFGAISDAGCVPLARVPEGSQRDIKRALDAGAWGIIVPMVDTVALARKAIDAAKYPPIGNRSLGGTSHGLNFGARPSDYYAGANDQVLVVLQIESPTGIANADEICRLPGVDVIFVGPRDLQARLTNANGGPATNDDFEAAVAKVIAIGKASGIPTGMFSLEVGEAQNRANQGMQMLSVSSDLRFMATKAADAIKVLKPETNGRVAIGY